MAHRLCLGAGYDGVNFELFEPGAEELATANTFALLPEGLLEEWKELEQRGGSSLHEIVARTLRPAVVNDAFAHERLSEEEGSLARRFGIRSLLAAPMLWKGELIGVLHAGSKRTRAFNSRHRGELPGAHDEGRAAA